MTPILQMKELSPQCLKNLPKFPQLISGRARILIQAVWLESVLYHFLDWQLRNSKAPKEKAAGREQIKYITKLWKVSSDWLPWRTLSTAHGKPLQSPFQTSAAGDSGFVCRCEHEGGWNQAGVVITPAEDWRFIIWTGWTRDSRLGQPGNQPLKTKKVPFRD